MTRTELESALIDAKSRANSLQLDVESLQSENSALKAAIAETKAAPTPKMLRNVGGPFTLFVAGQPITIPRNGVIAYSEELELSHKGRLVPTS